MTKVDAPRGSLVLRGLADQSEVTLGAIEIASARMWKGSPQPQGDNKHSSSVVRVSLRGTGLQGASLTVLLDLETTQHLIEALTLELANAPR